MEETGNSSKLNRSPRGDWWGGCLFLAGGIFFLQLVLRGRTWIPYKRYGGGTPMDGWQVVGIGLILSAMGIWQLVIAIRKTRLNRHQRTQIGIGSPLTGTPSHTTELTDRVFGGSAVRDKE